MRFNKKSPLKSDKKSPPKTPKKGVVGYNKKTALLEEAITQMNEGKYGRSSAALKELLALDPLNTEARRLFATLHLRLGSLISARTAFESLAREALDRQDFWLAESLLREYLTAGPRCVPFLDMLGQVYEQKGDSVAAVAEYGKAIEVLIEDPDSDHPDRASDLFAKIRSLAAGSPEAMRLAALFDSATGQLLRPPSVSNPVPLSEASQSSTESLSTAGDSTLIPTEAPQSYTDPVPEPEAFATSETPAVPEAPISMVEQPQQNASQTAPTEATENHEALNPPFKLADEAATTPSPTIATDIGLIQEPTHGTAAVSLEKDSEPASEVLVESIAVRDLSLHKVTQPIAEAPASPVSMPWDQVQDTTLSIPLPSVEPESDQMPGLETAEQSDSQSIPSSTETVDDQPILPVQPESFLSSMSWEEILAEVGKGSDIPLKTEPTASAAPPDQAEQYSPVLEHPAFDSKDPVLTPISEPVAEGQVLPVPMPWEQVEEEPVPILQHEPEPDFGFVAEHPLPPVKDEPEIPSFEDLKSDANDATLVIDSLTAASPVEQEQSSAGSSTATPHEPIEEQFVEPFIEPPLDQSCILPAVEQISLTPVIPSEPPSTEPAPGQSITEETPPPVLAEVAAEPAIVVDSPPVVQEAEPAVLHIETEAASPEPAAGVSITEEAAPELAEVAAEPAIVVDSPLVVRESEHATAPSPPGYQDVRSAPSDPPLAAATPTDPATALEESCSTSHTADPEPPLATSEEAPSGEINILWNEGSAQSNPEQPKAGLLSRWLRKAKQDEPPSPTGPPELTLSEPSHEPTPAMPPVASELNERSTPEPTIPVIATSDLSRDHSAPSLRSGEEKARHAKTSHRSVPSLSNRIVIGAGRFISGCFSTTRSIIISLIVLVSTIVVSGLAGVGLTALSWVFMEERPNSAFHNLNVTPQRTLQEATTNGYLALLGFDRGAKQDATQAGFARKFEKSDLAMTAACLMNSTERRGGGSPEAEGQLARWYRDPDPAVQFRAQAASLRSWVNEADRSMARYKQWLTMPFEDWGYGELMSPNCPVILHAHRLYVADGFAQDVETGMERLAIDLAMWRNIMAQAKSLSIKMLAVNAVDDDTAVVSGLLGRPDLDERLVARLAKAARPLDQGEQSLRWPMQSELKAAPKTQDTLLKADSGETPIYVSMISMMPLPIQKRLNSYADYYEASGKAATELGFAGLPKRAGFVRYPAESWLDYGLNPIENILGVPPLPEWQTYGGRILELDAKLRLAGLQAWIKRSPKEQDIPTRMAKAGQALYDPFTGFPMLVNRRKGLIYSVGQDGKDHDGQAAFDIAAVIPPQPGGFPSDSKHGTSLKTRP